MAETGNTSKIGEIVFSDIFRAFGWQRYGPTNHSWACIKTHKQSPPKDKKHSTDAVYYYDDPYLASRIFVNVDFKAYSVSKIEKSLNLALDVQKLANTTECANASTAYASLFHTPDNSGETVGLLFVHNYDHQYDYSKFAGVVQRTPRNLLDTSRHRRVYIVGPDTVDYLAALSNDMNVTRGIITKYASSMFYPHLEQRKAVHDSAFTLESLLGPWQIVKYVGVSESGQPDTQYHIYTRKPGSDHIEFEYLIDYMFTYQLLDRESSIIIKMPYASDDASVKLENAKTVYIKRCNNLTELRNRLGHVKIQRINSVQLNVAGLDMGMSNE